MIYATAQPKRLTHDKIAADLAKGVLTVTLPTSVRAGAVFFTSTCVLGIGTSGDLRLRS